MHSGMFGGPAPDALLALISMLATLRDARGNTTIQGLECDATWQGVDYPPEQFRADAHVLDGVDLLGDGTRGGHALVPPGRHRARHRLPAGGGLGRRRCRRRRAPGSACGSRPAWTPSTPRTRSSPTCTRSPPGTRRCEIEPEAAGQPFTAAHRRPGLRRDERRPSSRPTAGPTTTEGQGGSIPLCNVLHETFPDAEIMLIGVEEPRCLIHAPNESVDPAEIEHMALAEALFLANYPT